MSDFADVLAVAHKELEGDSPRSVIVVACLMEMEAAHAEVEAERDKFRGLIYDCETTEATIAIQEREEARDQLRAVLAGGYKSDDMATMMTWAETALDAATADEGDKATDTGDTNTDDERGEQDGRAATDRR